MAKTTKLGGPSNAKAATQAPETEPDSDDDEVVEEQVEVDEPADPDDDEIERPALNAATSEWKAYVEAIGGIAYPNDTRADLIATAEAIEAETWPDDEGEEE